jgi:hypothetical protein
VVLIRRSTEPRQGPSIKVEQEKLPRSVSEQSSARLLEGPTHELADQDGGRKRPELPMSAQCSGRSHSTG